MPNQQQKVLSTNKSSLIMLFVVLLVVGCVDQSKGEKEIFNSGIVAKETSNGFFLFKNGRPVFRYVGGESSSHYELYSRSGPVVTVEIDDKEDFPIEVGQVIEIDGAVFLVRRDMRGEQIRKVEINWEVEE